jgi:hypothetical protein
MATFNIFIARSKFNFENNLTKFIGELIVRLKYFETHGEFIAPKKLKILIDYNDGLVEHIVDLKINEINKCYFPHYLGYTLNCNNAKISIIALSESIENIKESISYSITFENIDDDKKEEHKPLYIPDSKHQYA